MTRHLQTEAERFLLLLSLLQGDLICLLDDDVYDVSDDDGSDHDDGTFACIFTYQLYGHISFLFQSLKENMLTRCIFICFAHRFTQRKKDKVFLQKIFSVKNIFSPLLLFPAYQVGMNMNGSCLF